MLQENDSFNEAIYVQLLENLVLALVNVNCVRPLRFLVKETANLVDVVLAIVEEVELSVRCCILFPLVFSLGLLPLKHAECNVYLESKISVKFHHKKHR